METVDETVARAKKLIQPTVSANELVNPPAKVTPPVPQINTNTGARTAGLIDTTATNTEGFIQAQSEEATKAKELATLLGTQTFDGAGERANLTEQFGVTADTKRLKDIQTQLAKRNVQTELQKAQATEGGAGAIQSQRALNLADKQAAIRDAGLAAEANILQGNIETASTLINNAMSDYYQDRQLDNQNKIQQLEYFSGIADDQTAQLLQKEQRKYEEDQKKVERVLNTTDAAVVSGVATTDEIKQLSDPTITDETRLRVAQSIVARKAQQEFNLDRAIKGLQYDKLGLEIQSEEAKILAAQKAEDAGILTPNQATVATDLRKELNNTQVYKNALDLEAQTGALLASLEQKNGVSDIAAINAFQRLAVDPGVAVREGDVSLLQSAQSFTDQKKLQGQGLWVGDKLTPEARKQMSELVRGVYKFRVDLVDENTSQIRTMAKEQGIDYGKYVGKSFASFEEIMSRVNQEDAIIFGIGTTTDEYLDNIYTSLSSDPNTNPFGVSLE
jgi:hypothetical protein